MCWSDITHVYYRIFCGFSISYCVELNISDDISITCQRLLQAACRHERVHGLMPQDVLQTSYVPRKISFVS